MPLVTTKNMLDAARDGKYAVGAFNAENMEMVQAIAEAAESLNAPVIIQTTPGTARYAPLAVYCANVAAIAAASRIPVAIHLDHGDSAALAMLALRAGYTSVMIDGSHLPLDGNIALTRRVVEACAPCGVPVEGELGRVGGKEDGAGGGGTGDTDPEEAGRFVRETGVSSLAVGVGTAHGIYAAAPRLNIGLISILKKLLPIPLVLHGASGLSDDAVRECISRGICKVNFATELRQGYTAAVRRSLAENPGAIDPKKYGAPGREAVREQVMARIHVCGCGGKAGR